MEAVVHHVLGHYPLLGDVRREPLGSGGGFSGASVWRLETLAGLLCLRAAAPGESLTHLLWRHELMRQARAAGLAFVPTVLPTRSGTTAVEAAGRVWELLEWMPGRADYRAAPSPARLQEAVLAVAAIHRVWDSESATGPPPAVQRRLEAVRVWRKTRAGLRPAGLPAPWQPLWTSASGLLEVWMPRVERSLNRVPTCRLQPCLRDVWHDHLLFDGERLTGLIDYAAVAIDSVATDLARLLGSLAEDEDATWHFALDCYRQKAPLSGQEEELARLLDRTGVVVGIFHWLMRWAEATPAGLERLEGLVRRVERWK